MLSKILCNLIENTIGKLENTQKSNPSFPIHNVSKKTFISLLMKLGRNGEWLVKQDDYNQFV